MKPNERVNFAIARGARQSMNILRIAAAVQNGELITINGRIYEVATRADLAVTTAGNVPIDCTAAATAAAAAGLLTLVANAGAGETVTIGSKTYTFRASLTASTTANEVLIGATATATLLNLLAAITIGTGAGSAYGSLTTVNPTVTAAAGSHVAATGTLTSDNTNVADAATVTIDTKVYTFKTALTPTEGEVLIGADADASLLNLIRAINHTGTAGTDYSCAAAHPTVSAAASVTSHAFAITARTAGAAGNLLASTETSSHLSFGAATLTGGSSKLNLTALAKGTAGNSLATTETMTSGSFGASTLADGVDPTAAEFTTAFTACINADTGGEVRAERITANEVLLTSEQNNKLYACTETLAGSNNVFAAAAMFGGADVPAELPAASIVKRAATATEVTLLKMHFIFGHDVSAAFVQVRDTSGVIKAFDGATTYSGRRVTLASSGSTNIAATDEVTVIAA